MGNTESNLIASASAVAIVASLAVLYAFYKPFLRVLTGDREWGDMLGAGIWVRALGTIFAGSTVIIRSVWRIDILGVYLAGWALVVMGYYLHFNAWQAVYFSSRKSFALEFALFLVLIGFGAFTFFAWVNPA